jgi:hypothetical protein
MNTSFAGNQVGSMVSLDLTNSYPDGLLAQLAPYNDSQLLIHSQLTYTANQAEISAQQGAAYALQNIELERTGTLLPTSALSQTNATVYINQANAVNYANQNVSNSANVEYTNALAVEKACKDASYSAYLTTEASQVRFDRISTNVTVLQLGNSNPYINPLNVKYLSTISTISTLVANFKQDSQDDVNDASGNVQAYITNTQRLINDAIIKSTTVTANLRLVAAIYTFTKSVTQALSFPLLEISGKETLVTQNIPSIILTAALQLTTKALTYLNALISKISSNIREDPPNPPNVTDINIYANTLNSIARSNDINLYFQEAVQNNLIKTVSTMVGYGTTIAIPTNNPYLPFNINKNSEYTITNIDVELNAAVAAANARAVGALIIAAQTTSQAAAAEAQATVVAAANAEAAISPISARNLAVNADTTASNANRLVNSIDAVNDAYFNNITPEPIILTTVLDSFSFINLMLDAIKKVTNNTSAHAGVAIATRASNTLLGNLENITEKEEISLKALNDSNSVLILLQEAYDITATITDLSSIQRKHWATNAATARAKEVADQLKNQAFILNRTAHNLVSPAKIATLTAVANDAAALNATYTSRVNRASRNVVQLPPPAYNGFKADIRAKTFVPIRPSLDQLVFNNRIQPLTLDSLRTLPAYMKKVTQNVQEIKDNSRFSYRQ